ncbi:MAG: transposase [Gammaproteobacteria bacterium]|nr:transposase [Gammaproteobacteria bacterium]
MPRPLRIEYSCAWYHVMNRGANRMKIFTTDEHRQIFLKLLKEISLLFQIEIHSYCLMDNHYHLLLQTLHPNLGKAMRHLSGIYTLRYNRSLNRDGPLFRGRYKAILIEANTYILKVSRYIHLNPTEAKVVEHPANFKWSSYNNYVDEKKSNWIHTTFILDFFGHAKNYAEFVSEGIDSETKNFYDKPQLSSVLGTSKFINKKIESLHDDYQFATQADVNRLKKLIKIEEIANHVSRYFDISVSQLKTARQKNNFPRLLAMYLAREMAQSSHQKISDYFTGIKRFSVSTALIRCRCLIEDDPKIKMHFLKLKKNISEES